MRSHLPVDYRVLSGFCPVDKVATPLIGAELLVLVVVGFFFVRRQLSFARPFVTHRLVTHSAFFTLDRHVNSARSGAQMCQPWSTFYLQNRAGP